MSSMQDAASSRRFIRSENSHPLDLRVISSVPPGLVPRVTALEMCLAQQKQNKA